MLSNVMLFFKVWVMVVPLISLGKEGEGQVLEEGRGKVMMVTAEMLSS